jgi:hypothetical protein
MPKTAINEDRNSGSRKSEVWTPEYRKVSPPTSNVLFSKQLNKPSLRGHVSLSLNPGHDF